MDDDTNEFDINDIKNYTIITPAEIEAGMVMTRYRGVMSTSDSFKKDADHIIDLAERIKKEREGMKGM
jgi:hypothetical protein